MLVDTSVWIDHFRQGNERLVFLLERESVVTHELIVGEIACGGLRNRNEILALLRALPCVPTVQHSEALSFVEDHRLWGRGLGWIDVHLMASAKLAASVLWTLDRRLAKAGEELGVHVDPAC